MLRTAMWIGVALLASGCLQRPVSRSYMTAEPILTNNDDGGGTGSGSTTGGSGGTPAEPLAISPTSITIAAGGTATFSAAGGKGPYTFVSNGGETIATDGKFKAGPSVSSRMITLRDSVGATATATVQITVGAAATPNDPLLGNETNILKAQHDINAVGAWGISINCRNKPVAVLDTGVDINHPDLMANIWTNPAPTKNDLHGWNYIDDNNDPTDQNFHGTHVAGTIGAVTNNGRGVAGICWQANIIPVRFLDQDGSGAISDAVDSINYAVGLGAKIINASWGIPANSAILSNAVQGASNAGVLIVAAAGNDGLNIDQNPSPPASYNFPGVIAVGAVDANDALASFSNFGTGHTIIAAPGVNVLSTFPNFRTAYQVAAGVTLGAYGNLDGTSMAAPHVTGAIALFWSLYPNFTAAQVKARLTAKADAVPGLQGQVLNGNRLNVKNLMVDP